MFFSYVHALANKVKSSLGASTNSSQKLYGAEIAVFGSRAHLEKQALAIVNLYCPQVTLDICVPL